MPAAKDSPGFYSRLHEFMQRVPGGALVFAVIPLLFIGYFGWKTYGANKIDVLRYGLKLEKLDVSPQPSWIKSDVRAEVFRTSRLDRISLLDTAATPSIAQAFEAHPWVRTVTVVKKVSGGNVQVKLHYRKPVAMVYCEPDPSKPSAIENPGVLPVDAEGILLPHSSQQFDQTLAQEFLRIVGYKLQPEGGVSQEYGDPSLEDSLKLVEFLAPEKDSLRLLAIHVLGPDFSGSGSSSWLLGVRTKDGRRVVWGHPPGKEVPGEKLAAEKLSDLRNWLASNPPGGTESSLNLWGGNASAASFSP